MSVQPGPTFKRYAANGVATVYTIPFLLLDAADLQITLDGTLVTTGFTLSGIGNSTSSCTFTSAPTGDLLFLQVVPFQRLADYQMNGDFLSQTVNRDFDRLWLAVKQLNRDSGRALTVSLLEPEGIPPLPVKAIRALKVLAFDVDGAPVTSTLTLAQLEQQPALALESATASAASAVSANESMVSAGVSANASAASAAAASSSAQSVAYAALQLGMSTWGYRPQPFPGFALDDGQELDRSVYPAFAAALDAGLLPTVTQAQWNADPANRACFVAISSAGKFRMRDLNGKSAGSLGRVFLGGDGALSAGTNGIIQDSQNKSHSHNLSNQTYNSNTTTPGPINLGGLTGTDFQKGTGTGTYDGAGVSSSSGGVDARPVSATGAWMTRLFGVITPLGSAESASLATAYASLASRISALEASFVSADTAWVAGSFLTFPHGLGMRPQLAQVEAVCVIANTGYIAGDVVELGSAQFFFNGSSYGFNLVVDATNVKLKVAADGITLINPTTGVVGIILPASWKLRVKLRK